MDSKFENLTIAQLKMELKKRSAKQSGRKKELVERLDSYERNKNFGQSDVCEADYHITLPDYSSYYDVNTDTKFCPVTLKCVNSYLEQFGKDLDITFIKKIYSEKFLLYYRLACDDTKLYVRSCCHAEMSKNITYKVDIVLTKTGDIVECQCECAAGMGPSAHCKHVCTVLYASVVFATKEIVNVEETCTQKLQSFQKCKKYMGSPLKVNQLDIPGADEFTSIDFDPRPLNFRNTAYYNDHFRNACLSVPGASKMPIFQLFEPANNLAVAHDHDYLLLTPEDHFLEIISVLKLSPEERNNIERRTLGQSKNPQWYDERTKRLSSSMFGRIVKAVNSNQTDKTKLANSLVNVSKISAPSLSHGLKYEEMAISKYMSESGEEVKKCGIVVSEEFPFLSCSPDGVINSKRIVEVKCPYSAKDKQIDSVTVPYLKLNQHSEYYLDKKHDYYFQIQGQLLCTNSNECVLIIYTVTDMVHFVIHRDQDFINEMIKDLKSFFNLYFKNALLEKRFYKTYVH